MLCFPSRRGPFVSSGWSGATGQRRGFAVSLVVFISCARKVSLGRGEGEPEETPVRMRRRGGGGVSGAAPEGAMHYPSIVILQLTPDVFVHSKIPCFWAMRVETVLPVGPWWMALTADHAPNRARGAISEEPMFLVYLDGGGTVTMDARPVFLCCLFLSSCPTFPWKERARGGSWRATCK